MSASRQMAVAWCSAVLLVACFGAPVSLTAQSHPCPERVDWSPDAAAPETQPTLVEAAGARRAYFQRVLLLQLDDTVSTEGVCRILREVDAQALTAVQPQDLTILVVSLAALPATLEELEARRAEAERIAGVRRAAVLEKQGLIRPLD